MLEQCFEEQKQTQYQNQSNSDSISQKPNINSSFCVICLQNYEVVDSNNEKAENTTKNFKQVFETFFETLRMSEDLKSLTSFADPDNNIFAQVFHCCVSCSASLIKLHELHEQLKLISNETALLSATLTAKIIESSKSIGKITNNQLGNVKENECDLVLDPGTGTETQISANLSETISESNNCNSDNGSGHENTSNVNDSIDTFENFDICTATSSCGNGNLLLDEIVAEQLNPGSGSGSIDPLNWTHVNWSELQPSSPILPLSASEKSSDVKIAVLPDNKSIEPKPQSDLNGITVNYQIYHQSVPKEVRQFRKKVVNYYSVKVSLTNVNDLSQSGTALDPRTESYSQRIRPRRRRKSENPRSLSSISKSESLKEDKGLSSHSDEGDGDDDYNNDATYSPTVCDTNEIMDDFRVPVLLSNVKRKRSVKTLKKSKAKIPTRKNAVKFGFNSTVSDVKGNEDFSFTALQAQGSATTSSKNKNSGFVKTRKSKSKMYCETSPNKYLYGDKFPFEKLGDSFKCGTCDFSYDFTNRITPMVNHVKERHFMKKTNRPYYKSRKLVTIAPNKFLYVGQFVIEKVDEIYKCGTCNYSSENRQLTCRHVRLQHFMTEKTKECKFCGKYFQTTDKLNLHEARHKDERPYTCEICGKSFKTAPCLSSHKKTHADDVDKNKQCEICGKKFAYTQVLKNHLVTHTGEKKFECDLCHSKFRDAGTLTNHRRIHEGLKLYSCDICGMKFSQSGSVNRHVRSVHHKIPRSDSKKLYKNQGGNEVLASDSRGPVQSDTYVTPTFMTYPLSAHFPYK